VRTYFIDFENVHFGGLDGIDELIKGDIVYIFCNESQYKSLVKYQSENKFNCSVKIKECIVKGKNSIDFQLATFLGFSLGNPERYSYLYVISKDKGYDSSITFVMKDFKLTNIARYPTIKDTLELSNEPIQKKLSENSLLHFIFTEKEIRDNMEIRNVRQENAFNYIEHFLTEKGYEFTEDGLEYIKSLIHLIFTRREEEHRNQLMYYHLLDRFGKNLNPSLQKDLKGLFSNLKFAYQPESVVPVTDILETQNMLTPITDTKEYRKILTPKNCKMKLDVSKIISIVNNSFAISAEKRLVYVKSGFCKEFGTSQGIIYYNDLIDNIQKLYINKNYFK